MASTGAGKGNFVILPIPKKAAKANQVRTGSGRVLLALRTALNPVVMGGV